MNKITAVCLVSLWGACLSVCAQQAPLPDDPGIRGVLSDIRNFRDAEKKRDSALRRPLGSFTEEDFKRRYTFYASADRSLQEIDTAVLSFSDRIDLTLLRYSLEDELSEYRYRNYLNPLLSEGGFHTELTWMTSQQFNDQKDVEAYIDRLNDIPRYVDEHLGLMRSGLAQGICQPREIFEGYAGTYEQHIVRDPRESMFWKPFTKKPQGMDEPAWQRLCAAGEEAVRKQVIGSYARIRDFFNQEYLPKTRTTAGAGSMPGGAEYYRERVRHYTTTDMTPEEVYQIGLREVERIGREMQEVIREVGFKGTLQAFISQLRNDPRFLPTSAEQLLKEASYIAKKADGKLPLLFGRLPRQPYGVEPVPADIAPVYTGGRYSPAPIRGKRAGQYWVNTYNLKSRTLYTLEALTLHEAVPGHHLQMSLTQELDNLPEFRRNLYVNAFGEGWGLYCEFLGYEMGFYRDPYSRFGQLTYDMWRACRLVIDVGLHAKGWSREQSVKYLAEHTALSLHEVNTEINRYMAWPGQAVAYKTGELRIRSLRRKCEEQLGDRFDIRRFHDLVLSEGTVTMDILERMVDRHIARTKAGN